MTLLSVVKDVCAVVGVQRPTSVIPGIDANRTMQEMLALATEMANRIAYDYRDWTVLRTVKLGGAFGGPGAVFPMPVNYKRMLLTSNVWRSSNYQTPMRFVPDTDEYLNRRARGLSESPGEWTLVAGEMYVNPPLSDAVGDADAEAIHFTYMDKNCIRMEGPAAGYGEAFLHDGDTFRLDERLLKLGMIWQWKQNKGTSYAEDMGTFETAMAVAMGHDRPAPIIAGRHPISANVRTAYPWPVPT